MLKKITSNILIYSSILTFVNHLYAITIQEAFQNAKITGSLKNQYFTKENNKISNSKSSILVVGGNLNLRTVPINNLSAKFSFQTSEVLTKNDKQNNYKSDMDVSGSILSQAYLQHNTKYTTIKLGRQYINTKLINSSTSRILKESFKGLSIQNKYIRDTILKAIYITKYQKRTNNNGEPSKFYSINDKAYSIQIKNKSIKNLLTTIEYLKIKSKSSDNNRTLYIESMYQFNKKYKTKLSLQTYQGDNTKSNKKSYIYGIKLSSYIKKLYLSTSYSTQNSVDITSGIGENTNKIFTSSIFDDNNYIKNSKIYKLKFRYKLTKNILLTINHNNRKFNNNNIETIQKEYNIISSYKVNKSLLAQFGYAKFKNNKYKEKSRIYLKYTF